MKGHLRHMIGGAVLAGAMVLVGWGAARGSTPDIMSVGTGQAPVALAEQTVGRFQAVAPDLCLDTATGKLVDGSGRMLEPPADPSGQELGRFTAAGYVTAVTRSVGLNVIQSPVANTELVKGYVIADSKTGRVLKSRIYYARPLDNRDLRP